MHVLTSILIAAFLVSLLSFIGVIFLFKKKMDNLLFVLVSFAVGALLGGAFLHLLPEALEIGLNFENIFLYTLAGIVIFFVLEKFLYWRHCHHGKCHTHTFTYMSLLGDGVHNFIDGMIIAAGFLANNALGITTTVAIALHEIPQEIGDFSILVYGGFSKKKALLFNFLSAITAVFGALLVYSFSFLFEGLTNFLLPFAAGGFIYIAASDLIPELHKERRANRSLIQLIFFLFGIVLMYLFKFI